MATLHIYLDESGDFGFTAKGSQFYVFTVVWTYNPAPMSSDLSALRYRLIKDGHFRPGIITDLSGFHACDDPRPRREAVMEVMLAHSDWNFASIVVEKNRVNPTLYEPKDFYPKFLSYVINFVLRGRLRPWTSNVLLYTDTLPMGSKADSNHVNLTIKASCQRQLSGKTFHVMHHSRDSSCWLQVADYCSWSICRKWEYADTVAYDKFRSRLAATEIAPMSAGDGKTYY